MDNVTKLGYAIDEWQNGGNWSIEDTAAVQFAGRVNAVL
jgi:hypothetical protein